jgi:phosphoribosylamine--glycine ligase
MKIMLIGSGGREHALAWKLAQSKKVTTIYVVPGNAGTEMISKCCNVNLFTNENLVNFAKDNHIDLTIVGPENLLVEGIVNLFKQNKLDIIGPSQKAAQLEGNKTYAKQFMERFKIPTAKFKVFSEPHSALAYLENTTTFPVVVKANGLAAGKGVVICKNLKAARETITDFMIDHSLKDAGNSIVMEEFFSGVETSIICITDGKTMVPLVSAQDHKTIHEHGVGLNTGGMGAVCPNPHVNQKVMDDFTKHIMIPTLNGIKQSKLDFHGFLFFGIMITNNGCKCLEYNVRMGDPECQSIVPLMNFDLVALFQTVIKNQLHTFKFL